MRGAAIALVLALAAPARADEVRHVVYAEAFGKAGAYGLGYEVDLTRGLGAGAAASFVPVDGERVTTIAPYLHLAPLRAGRHALIVQLGPVWTRIAVPSPVPEWDGLATQRTGGEVTAGWERRGRVLVRVTGTVAFGAGGVVPWLGAAIGAQL
ncbi:MAG: hypothetical protein K8W52_17810 [Deltaproteobacteria bacterium]|nr:hypothetical protein [Deltaproteobacteria bacterium]